jgi:hypothetical protein
MDSLRRKSNTVVMRPRTEMMPSTSARARGTSVIGGGFKISRTALSGSAYASLATRNARNSRMPSFASRRGESESRTFETQREHLAALHGAHGLLVERDGLLHAT